VSVNINNAPAASTGDFTVVRRTQSYKHLYLLFYLQLCVVVKKNAQRNSQAAADQMSPVAPESKKNINLFVRVGRQRGGSGVLALGERGANGGPQFQMGGRGQYAAELRILLVYLSESLGRLGQNGGGGTGATFSLGARPPVPP